MPNANLELVTTRLRLIAGTAETLEAAVSDLRRFAALVGAKPAAGWPPPENHGYLRSVARMMRVDAGLAGWGPWLLIVRDDGTVIGDAGFKGKPEADGSVEIGYGVVPAYQRRGLATEAVQALMRWALEHRARTVVAECEPDNIASVRVLEKAGLRQVGRSEGMLRWRVDMA